MKKFKKYLVKALRSFGKAKKAFRHFEIAGRFLDYPINKAFRAFYTFVETHKGVLKVENLDVDLFVIDADERHFIDRLRIDAFDKMLKVRRSYYINLENEKLEEVVELI